MTARWLRCALVASVLSGLTSASARAGGLPDWLDAALEEPSPASSEHHAHLLLHEQLVSLRTPGKVVTRDRGAVRVLDHQGAEWARTDVRYLRTSARVKSLRGWLVGPDRKVRELGRSDAVDQSLTSADQLESEARRLVLIAANAPPRAVFAWEWVVEEDPLLAEQSFWFAEVLPCARLVYELELAPGMQPRTVATHGDAPAPVRNANTWRWEVRDLSAWPDEPWSPSPRAWTAHVVVAPEPAGDAWGSAFKNWAETGTWLHRISEPSLAATPEIERKALEVVGTEKRPLERARALARYAQSVNYLSVEIGLARGEGYRPRPAATVLGTGYGDCKDMASLYCSLARSIGLEAWLVSATTLGRDAVRPDWATPVQFNHCIAAVSVPPGTGLESVVEDTPLGPLAFFDATNSHVPFGNLSHALAGSFVLLEHPQRSQLLRLPAPVPERDRSTSSLVGELDSLGTLTATWSITRRGASAWAEQARRARSATEWRTAFDRGLAEWLGPCRVTRLAVEPLVDSSDVFQVTAELVAPRFARALGGDLIGFRTPVIPTTLRSSALDTLRRTPIALQCYATEERQVIRLPASWRLEEPPRPVSHSAEFGNVSGAWSAVGDTLRFAFDARVSPVTLPSERYPEWRAFARDWALVNRAQVLARRH